MKTGIRMDNKKKKVISSPVMMICLILILVTVITYLIPSGEFVRSVNPITKITEVDSSSFLASISGL